MGRKAIDKIRKENPQKKRDWAIQVLPFLMKNGLRGITMDQVAKELGKSKATIYKYFTSQEEIVSLIIEYKLDQVKDFVGLLHNQEIPYLDRYFQAMSLFTEHISEVSTLFLRDVKHLFPAVWQKVNFFMELAVSMVRGYYEQGIVMGIIDDFHPAILVMSDRFLFNALGDPDFLMENNLSIHEAFEQYFRMKFRGIVKAEHRSLETE